MVECTEFLPRPEWQFQSIFLRRHTRMANRHSKSPYIPPSRVTMSERLSTYGMTLMESVQEK
jgi:hypothetical protein